MEFGKHIQELLVRAEHALREARDARAAEVIFREYAGKQGLFREKLREIGKLQESARSSAGKTLHDALNKFQIAADNRLREFREQEEQHMLTHERLDVTLPGIASVQGTLHPITVVRRQAEHIFQQLGFSLAEGPEAETAWYNFDALNIPENHPARDLWDTFWLKSKAQNPKSKLLLRTHTSPVQIRFMETHQPPFRVIAPGVCYRYEATDASHDVQFWQIEGLMVDRRDAMSPVSMATLLSVLTTFFERFFKKPVALRVRPSYFPFVEPGIEVDLSCIVCGGTGRAKGLASPKLAAASEGGCSVCKQTGWLEMLGAGMVHPKVFEAVGYNPKEVQGFAFGFGIDRLAMLKYRIPDIRLFRYGDIRFLKQFR